MEKEKINNIEIPSGGMCGYNCADGCIHWQPYDRNSYGEQWCSYLSGYYSPKDRQGCVYFKR